MLSGGGPGERWDMLLYMTSEDKLQQDGRRGKQTSVCR